MKSVSAGEMIKRRLAELGLSQAELSLRVGEHFQTISALIKGRRDITVPLSIRIDEALGLEPGTIAIQQVRNQVEEALSLERDGAVAKRKLEVVRMIKQHGGFWSYSGIPEHQSDDDIIEAALIHLELEELPILRQIWSRAHIKKVWKERLVSQGSRMNILNYILALKFFKIHHPDDYFKRYGNN